MKNMKDDPTATWYCAARYVQGLDCIQYFPEQKDPKTSKENYVQKKWFKTEAECKEACAKLNKATKIGKNGMKANNKKCYEKMTLRKLIAKLESFGNLDQEIVIYPKYTGADTNCCDKYRFTVAEMEDQWHQNYPYIALMF